MRLRQTMVQERARQPTSSHRTEPKLAQLLSAPISPTMPSIFFMKKSSAADTLFSTLDTLTAMVLGNDSVKEEELVKQWVRLFFLNRSWWPEQKSDMLVQVLFQKRAPSSWHSLASTRE